jgi:hypothetical protein
MWLDQPAKSAVANCRTAAASFATPILYRLCCMPIDCDDNLRIYPCSMCKGLHVGHDPEPRARERRRIVHELRSLAPAPGTGT